MNIELVKCSRADGDSWLRYLAEMYVGEILGPTQAWVRLHHDLRFQQLLSETWGIRQEECSTYSDFIQAAISKDKISAVFTSDRVSEIVEYACECHPELKSFSSMQEEYARSNNVIGLLTRSIKPVGLLNTKITRVGNREFYSCSVVGVVACFSIGALIAAFVATFYLAGLNLFITFFGLIAAAIAGPLFFVITSGDPDVLLMLGEGEKGRVILEQACLESLETTS